MCQTEVFVFYVVVGMTLDTRHPTGIPRCRVSDLDYNWVRLATNKTNPRKFLRSVFSTLWLTELNTVKAMEVFFQYRYILVRRAKTKRKIILIVPDLSYLESVWANLWLTLISLTRCVLTLLLGVDLWILQYFFHIPVAIPQEQCDHETTSWLTTLFVVSNSRDTYCYIE